MAAVQKASATWEGTLVEGKGTVTALSSGLFKGLGITWKTRQEAPGGNTSPEELLAAAHAGCLCMALSHRLAGNNTPAKKLDVTAEVTFDKGVKGVSFDLRASVPGIDTAKFQQLADDAKDNCPFSLMMKGNVPVTLKATLV